ncbi:MAG: HAMP domain-containing histidine kinase [Bacteroidales bacterium]|jgi:signal transduction histidine kinase|nr:HAMP domain-containing histidine kinase [Bacteroidales bacterium]
MNKYQLTEEELLEELKNRMLQCRRNLKQLQEINEELKVANVKLNESEALKSHFLSNVTNEMVNPFASILGLSKSIMEIKDTDRAKSMAQLIYNEAFNLDFQLKNIFAAAKVEAGQTNVEINNVDINGVINSVIDTYKHKTEQKNLTVNFEYHVSEEVGDNFVFPTDAEMFKLIISNILSNGIKFSNNLSNIEIKTAVVDEELFVSIRDYGEGISHENLERIFDRFEKGNDEINSVNEGYGLGLSITKSYLDILGGRIDLSSEEGMGTLIIISIPRLACTVVEGMAFDGNEFLFDDLDNVVF